MPEASSTTHAQREWHEFHNDPTSDVILVAEDGVLLGASRHRLRALSAVLDDMFSLPPASCGVSISASGSGAGNNELSLAYSSALLAAIISFANIPLVEASQHTIARFDFKQCHSLLKFLMQFACPSQLWTIALSQWLKTARTTTARIQLAHNLALLNWMDGLNRVLKELKPDDWAFIYRNTTTFRRFVDGFPEECQISLWRALVTVKDGGAILAPGLLDLRTPVVAQEKKAKKASTARAGSKPPASVRAQGAKPPPRQTQLSVIRSRESPFVTGRVFRR